MALGQLGLNKIHATSQLDQAMNQKLETVKLVKVQRIEMCKFFSSHTKKGGGNHK